MAVDAEKRPSRVFDGYELIEHSEESGHWRLSRADRGANCEKSRTIHFLVAIQPTSNTTTVLDAHARAPRARGAPNADSGLSRNAARNGALDSMPTSTDCVRLVSSYIGGAGDLMCGGGASRCAGGGRRTSACATPPKKSVTSVLRSERGKRSSRTPGCELILTGS